MWYWTQCYGGPAWISKSWGRRSETELVLHLVVAGLHSCHKKPVGHFVQCQCWHQREQSDATRAQTVPLCLFVKRFFWWEQGLSCSPSAWLVTTQHPYNVVYHQFPQAPTPRCVTDCWMFLFDLKLVKASELQSWCVLCNFLDGVPPNHAQLCSDNDLHLESYDWSRSHHK